MLLLVVVVVVVVCLERGEREVFLQVRKVFSSRPPPHTRNRPLFCNSMSGILKNVFTFIVIVYTGKSSLCINSQFFSLIFNSLAYAFFDVEADTVTTNSPAKKSPTKGS